MSAITVKTLPAAQPLARGLALVLAAAALAAQPLPDEQALDVQYAAASVQAGGGVDALVAGDLDGDGDLDLVSADGGANRVHILLNRGAAGFAPSALTVGAWPSALALVDADADGDLDVLVGLYEHLRLLRNDGAGQFAPQAPLALAGADLGPVAAIPADVDGDGVTDVVVGLSHHSLPSGSYTGGVLVAFGDGRGGFVLSSTHALALPAHRLVAADFDGDGLLDVAELGGYVTASSVNVAFGAGDGTFVNAAGGNPSGMYASGFAAGDWDGDGDADLVTGSKYDLTTFLNGGAGTFTAGQSLGIGSYVKGIAAGDVDRDGDLDLAATTGSSLAMRVLGNDGAGQFAVTDSFSTPLQSLAVLLADTSGDGYLDPWAGDYDSGTLRRGDSHVTVARYGHAKPSSLGCLPAMTASGQPAAGGSGFAVGAADLLIDQPALVLAGLAAQVQPGLGGELLVQPPWFALAAVTSHGSGDPGTCDGGLLLPLDGAVLAAIGVGTRLHLQVLSRDPLVGTGPQVSLTDGLWFEVQP